MNQNIKKYISSVMSTNGYKKDVDYNVSTSCLYLSERLIPSRNKIKSSLQVAFPDVTFIWDKGNKLIWLL